MSNRFLICLVGLGILTTFLFYKGCPPEQKEFPSLDLPDEIQIKYSKTDSNTYYSYLEEFHLIISENNRIYKIIAILKAIPKKNRTIITKNLSYQTTISSKTIKSLLEAIHKDRWSHSKKLVEMIEKNDDYSNYTLIFISKKKEMFRLSSTSNTITGSPWNLQTENTLYITYDSYTGRAINTLLTYLRQHQAPS